MQKSRRHSEGRRLSYSAITQRVGSSRRTRQRTLRQAPSIRRPVCRAPQRTRLQCGRNLAEKGADVARVLFGQIEAREAMRQRRVGHPVGRVYGVRTDANACPEWPQRSSFGPATQVTASSLSSSRRRRKRQSGPDSSFAASRAADFVRSSIEEQKASPHRTWASQ